MLLALAIYKREVRDPRLFQPNPTTRFTRLLATDEIFLPVFEESVLPKFKNLNDQVPEYHPLPNHQHFYARLTPDHSLMMVIVAKSELSKSILNRFYENIYFEYIGALSKDKQLTDLSRQQIIAKLNAIVTDPLFCISHDKEHDKKMAALKLQLKELHQIMLDNIDKVMMRGEKIESLLAKTEALQVESFKFKQSAESTAHCCWLV